MLAYEGFNKLETKYDYSTFNFYRLLIKEIYGRMCCCEY